MGLAGGNASIITEMLCDFSKVVDKTGGSVTVVVFG
jgi:hypothetical protein